MLFPKQENSYKILLIFKAMIQIHWSSRTKIFQRKATQLIIFIALASRCVVIRTFSGCCVSDRRSQMCAKQESLVEIMCPTTSARRVSGFTLNNGKRMCRKIKLPHIKRFGHSKIYSVIASSARVKRGLMILLGKYLVRVNRA